MLLFEAVVRDLEHAGHDVVLTARDNAQTVPLGRERWPDIPVVGGPSPSGKARKAAAIAQRTLALTRFARGRSFDVALSHGSYAQVLAARAVGLPAVTMMDYEHQPANHVSFRLARRVVVPRVFPREAAARYGAKADELVAYDGFKEEVYLAGFEPDRAVVDVVGAQPGETLVVARTPPTGALYHRSGNDWFGDVVAAVASRPGTRVVLLERAVDGAAPTPPGVVRPAGAVDGRSLLALADAVIGGGGTMTREAALLGTPTWSVFAGRPAAVDAELVRLGRLRRLAPGDALPELAPRGEAGRPLPEERARPVLDAVARALREAVSG